MRQVSRASVIVAAGWLGPSTAFAHIDLLEPEARAHGTAARDDLDIDANSNLKSGPCGQMISGRTERVATYAPGQTITVRVREENAHVSYLRVSLDLDGEDFPLRAEVPAGPETEEVAAAAEAALGGEGPLAVYREDNDTPGFIHEIDVTLPNQSCTNCTLQVLQFMYDDPSAPYYFQCADLVIADAGGADDGGGAPTSGGAGPDDTGGSSNGGAGASAGSSNSASVSTPGANGTSAAGGSPSAQAGATTSAPGSMVPGSASPDSAAGADDRRGGSGCSMLRSARGPQSTCFLALLVLALGFIRRARRHEGGKVPVTPAPGAKHGEQP